MKTKTLLKISTILIIPMLFSVMIFCYISFEWFFINESKFAEVFLTGNFNRTFSIILFFSGTISLSFVLATHLSLIKYGDKIDKLDEAQIKTWEAKKKYDQASAILVDFQNQSQRKVQYQIGNTALFTKDEMMHFAAFMLGYVHDKVRPWGECKDIFEVWISAGKPDHYITPSDLEKQQS